LPLPQRVPSDFFEVVHAPPLQPLVVHSLPSSQFWHVFPPEPQAPAVVPPWQVEPLTQPVQHWLD
jgi:hypothetical protein